MPKKKQPLDLSPDWQAARDYHAASITHARLTVAAMAMLGRELLKLKKDLGFLGSGRRKKKVESDSTLTWEQWLEEEVPGLSRRVADNRIQLFDAVKNRLRKIGPAGVDHLLEARDLTPKEQFTLERLVHKATDGETVKSLFQDAGIAKLPQGSAATGGNLGTPHNDGDDDTPARQLAFAFFSEPFTKLAECRLHRDYKHLLYAMPPTGDAEQNQPGLVDLRHQLTCMIHEIDEALSAQKSNITA